MVSPGTGDIHLQWDPCLGLYPEDYHVHTGRDAEEDQGWLQHPPPCGERSASPWRKSEDISHCDSAPGTSPPTPDPQPIGKIRHRHAQCQRHHQKGGGAGVTAVWEGLLQIMQAVWEVYPAHGSVWLSKMDVTDAYHRGTAMPLQVGAFAYVVPLAPGEKG